MYPSPAGTLYDGYDFDWSNDLCSWAVDRPVLRLIPYQRGRLAQLVRTARLRISQLQGDRQMELQQEAAA
ncbi:hypothetical protein [Nonomuraea dietziae]|uniref:hypothetical protein n=1 Tax=Nonomuraea dietziae TaxID=65515 RepID=UPI0031CEE052